MHRDAVWDPGGLCVLAEGSVRSRVGAGEEHLGLGGVHAEGGLRVGVDQAELDS